MRARLIASQGFEKEAAPGTSSGGGFIYESPLIEQGTILLGGTKMEFGFALRQQFFHKCVLLLLQHDDGFTKGIILNRPSALEQDGFRLWCGHGQVAEGGIFVGEDAKMGELEISCLHSLTGPLAGEFSTTVIKGVSCTDLEGAKALVAAGEAERSDFYVCVGYSGWAPGQLQMEVEKRDSWFMASADSATLLAELLRQARALPPPSTDSAAAADLLGTETWSALMRGIGRGEDVATAEGSLADRMLSEWVRAHLLPKKQALLPKSNPLRSEASPAASVGVSSIEAPPSSSPVGVGTVLCTSVAPATGLPADRILLHEQFLHKAILLVLAESKDETKDTNGGGRLSACVLNRPTSTIAQFRSVPGSPKRHVGYTGSSEIGGLLWLHYRSDLFDGKSAASGVMAGASPGRPVGESGVYMLQESEASALLKAGTLKASDLLVVSAVVHFSRNELSDMVANGEALVVNSDKTAAVGQVAGPQQLQESLWPRVWGLMETTSADNNAPPGDGTEVWWLASQRAAASQVAMGTAEQPPGSMALAALPSSELADEALAEWTRFFAN